MTHVRGGTCTIIRGALSKNRRIQFSFCFACWDTLSSATPSTGIAVEIAIGIPTDRETDIQTERERKTEEYFYWPDGDDDDGRLSIGSCKLPYRDMCAAVECGYIDGDVVSSPPPPPGTMTLPSRSNGDAIDRRPIDSRFDFDFPRF